MRITHFSTSDFRGAAARGALALHHQLLERGISSRFFAKECLLKETEQVPSSKPNLFWETIQKICFDENLSHELASSFTLGYPGSGQMCGEVMEETDIIHLHDIKGLFSPKDISALLSLGKPVVWSLPDSWAFTGGCHHALECAGWKSDCKNCLQLKVNPKGMPSKLLEKKHSLFGAPNLHIVTSSRWLAERASASRVFCKASIQTLPPVLPEAICPIPKREAKAQLGLHPETFTLLVVCENTGCQQRHREAVKQLLENCALFCAFKKLARNNRLRILSLGTAPEAFACEWGVMHAGNVGNHKKLSLLLSAADVAVLPHFAENGSQIILEAGSCGTPVIAMNAEGADELIRDGVTGKLVAKQDLRRMAEEICHVALHREIQAEWQKNSMHAFAESPKDGVERHLVLYERLFQSPIPHEKTRAEFPPRESSDDLPVFMDSLESILVAPGAREEAAMLAATNFKRAIVTAMAKLTLAEQRIQKQLRGATQDPIIEKSVISIGKLRRYLARAMGEWDLNGDMQNQYFRFQASAAAKTGRASADHQQSIRNRIMQWLYDAFLKKGYTAKPGVLEQHAPLPLVLEKFPRPRVAAHKLPSIAIVTPSYMQGCFIEQTILSIIDQDYPKLRYAVQDAGSTDTTVEILKQHSSRITSWVSGPDTGQARAIASGFEKVSGDIMAWLNSDDLLMPGALRFVGEYFRRHPEVDAIYGHRIIINEQSQEIGRWVLPPHDPEILRSIDYVPQETLFWRASLWRKVGGISTNFRFAMDWDLLLRFQKVRANIVRVPYFLGCFRMHTLQKTSAQMETIGNQEVNFLRLSTPGSQTDPAELGCLGQRVAHQSALCAWLLRFGIRW
ncbi:MAG: glycosyltransferase [Verrucomicrobiota bacterium]